MLMSTAWYFAYGSNMQTATFRGRRGITYHRAVPACVRGWRLVFDKPGLLRVGESYANVVPDGTGEVLGVLYEIDEADLAHIDLTEGVLIGNYRRVAVDAQPLSPLVAGTIAAFTLTSERRDPSMQPSQRYMALLVEGAVEHGLPDAYVDFLRAVPACIESVGAALLRPLMDAALKGLRK